MTDRVNDWPEYKRDVLNQQERLASDIENLERKVTSNSLSLVEVGREVHFLKERAAETTTLVREAIVAFDKQLKKTADTLREENAPYKRLLNGLVALILVAVVSAILAGVIRNSGVVK
jgi:hypothetical protein